MNDCCGAEQRNEKRSPGSFWKSTEMESHAWHHHDALGLSLAPWLHQRAARRATLLQNGWICTLGHMGV